MFQSNHFKFNSSHKKALETLGDAVKDIEHYRSYEFIPNAGYIDTKVITHTSVIILKDGRCFVARAFCSPKDQYVRKIGYAKSMGRALGMANEGVRHSFILDDKNISGIELRDYCRKTMRLGVEVKKFIL